MASSLSSKTAKNGGPKPRLDAFQFGIRYSLNGKRKLDPAATLDVTVGFQPPLE